MALPHFMCFASEGAGEACTTDSTTLPAVCSILNPVAGTAYVMVEGVSNTASSNPRVDVLTK